MERQEVPGYEHYRRCAKAEHKLHGILSDTQGEDHGTGKERGMMAKRNPFTKEYYTGRKDQYDLDYALFRKAVEETETRDELIKFLEERFGYVIAKIADQNAKELMEDLELI